MDASFFRDLGPGAAAAGITGILLGAGLVALTLAEGPREFLASFRRGLRALRKKGWRYLIEVGTFASMVVFALGLLVSMVSFGAAGWFLVLGPAERLGDYRLYLPFAWTAAWLVAFLFLSRAAERMRKQEE